MNFERAGEIIGKMEALRIEANDHVPDKTERELNTPLERFNDMWSRIQSLAGQKVMSDQVVGVTASVREEDGPESTLSLYAKNSDREPGVRVIEASWAGDRGPIGDPKSITNAYLDLQPSETTLSTLSNLEEAVAEAESVARGDHKRSTFRAVVKSRQPWEKPQPIPL